MSLLKKATVFLVVIGIIFGYGMAPDNGFGVNGATAPPPATPPPPLKLQFYNGNLAPITNMIVMNYKIVNLGTTALNLADIKARYWYTSDGAEPQNVYIYYASIGTANITATIVRMTEPKIGADHYLEIGFNSGAGSLAPGDNVIVTAAMAKAGWGNFIQTNDYSFNPTATTFGDWDRVTGYYRGGLVWGREP